MAGGARESPSHQPQKSGACYNSQLCKSMHGCVSTAAYRWHVREQGAMRRATAGNFFRYESRSTWYRCNPPANFCDRKINIPI